jgi:hypothetical protein
MDAALTGNEALEHSSRSKMWKRSISLLAIATLLATLPTMQADRRGFDELLVRAAMAGEADTDGAKCPLSRDVADRITLPMLTICHAYGLSAYEAARRYPEGAARIFAVYGQDPVYQRVLDTYGHQVIPIIIYYVEHAPNTANARTGQRIITPEQYGLIAIEQIDRRGHEMLSGFEIVGDQAKSKWLTQILFGAKNLLVGGIFDVETVLSRGERLPTWKEVGWAVLDATIVAGTVGAVAKVAREVHAVGVAEKSTLRLASEGAVEAVTALGMTTSRIAPIAVAYVAVTRPYLIASGGGWIAEQLGFSRFVGIYAVYLIGIWFVLLALRPLWRLLKFATAPFRYILRHV